MTTTENIFLVWALFSGRSEGIIMHEATVFAVVGALAAIIVAGVLVHFMP
jgi:hypothetical protein